VTSIAVLNASAVVTIGGSGPVRGSALNELTVVENAGILCEGGRIVSVESADVADVCFDASGCTVVPGFVDPHTHLPFFGWRADEDAARLSGVPYETIHGREGGIFRSQRLLAEATDEDVLGFVEAAAASMLRAGTTTFETKSGYGLSVDAELRQLRLARRLAERVPQRVVATCLAAHAVPKERSAGEWVEMSAAELLPAAAAEDLCEAVDIYVETIAFSLEHAARLSHVAGSLGLAMRVHADQLSDGGAASFAARRGFRSADHLNHTSPEACIEVGESDTAAVLLPGATFTLRQNDRPPARSLIEAGAIVALGSDFNPGTSPLHSMPLVMALACRLYGLRPAEALAAATVNAAYVLGLDDEVGRIAPGYRADLVVLDAPGLDHVVYRPDADLVVATICAGEIAYLSPDAHNRVL
jgi:imidazolonepropionase